MKFAATLVMCALCAATFQSAAFEAPVVRILEFPKPASKSNKPASIVHSEETSQNLFEVMTAEMALNRDAPETAMKNYISAAKETQDPAIAQRATQIALTMGDLKAALLPSTIWAQRSKNDLAAQITTAAILIKLSMPQAAMPYLQQIMQIDPIDADRHFVMLYKQFPDRADQIAVIESLKTLSKLKGSNTPQVALADIAISENRLVDATLLASEGLKINAKDPKSSILYAQALFLNKRAADASKFLETQLKALPNSLPLQQYYTQFLIEQNEMGKALEEMKKLAAIQDLPAMQWLQLSQLCMQVGWLNEAEIMLKKVIKDPEQSSTANYLLARIYEVKNNMPEAIAYYQKINNGPFYIVATMRASGLLADAKEYDKALSLLDEAEPTNGLDFKRIILAKVDVMMKANQSAKAYSFLSDYLQQDPNDIDLLYSRGIVSERMNKIDHVVQDFQSILKIDPNHIETLNALGFILADKTNRYKEATTYIQKALELSPNNPSVLDTLGWIQFKMGNTMEAIATLKAALNSYPNPEIAAHLGEVLWSSNQQEEAAKVWKAALESSPNDLMVLQTMKRLVGNQSKN